MSGRRTLGRGKDGNNYVVFVSQRIVSLGDGWQSERTDVELVRKMEDERKVKVGDVVKPHC